MHSRTWLTNQIGYKVWLIIRNVAWAMFFVFIVAQPFNTNTVFAYENVSLYMVKPSQVIEGKQYSWPIPVKSWGSSGKLSYTGQLPCGLYLDTGNNTISGIASKGMSQSSYFAIIRLEDSFGKTEWTYEFTVVYESNISVSSPNFDVETNAFADGKQINAKLSNWQNTKQCFPSGVSCNITVDINIPSKYDTSVRYQPINPSIIVTNTSPDAKFEYYPEYKINIITKSDEITQYYNNIYSNKNQDQFIQLNSPQWYKKDSLLALNAPHEIKISSDTKYVFSNWNKSYSSLYNESSYIYKITSPGEIIANYDVYYYLDTDDEYVLINKAGWHKKDDLIDWKIKCYPPQPAEGLLSLLNVQRKPYPQDGLLIMDKPVKIKIRWRDDFGPMIGYSIATLILSIVGSIIGTILIQKSQKTSDD